MVAVVTGHCPLSVAGAAILLKAAPHCVLSDGVREGGGCFAQLGVKLSLFRTLPGGAPA